MVLLRRRSRRGRGRSRRGRSREEEVEEVEEEEEEEKEKEDKRYKTEDELKITCYLPNSLFSEPSKVELSEAEIIQIKTCSITLPSPESESGSELSDIFENLKKKFLNSYISMIIYILAPKMKEMMNLHCYLKITTRKMLKIWKILILLIQKSSHRWSNHFFH